MSPSLMYEILMYLNSFYFGMFSACEVGMSVLKSVNLAFPPGVMQKEIAILAGMIVIESFRIYFGRDGSLSDRGEAPISSPTAPGPLSWKPTLTVNTNALSGWKIFSSVFLTIPSGAAVAFLLLGQVHKLRLEMILCSLMLVLQLTELVVAMLFFCTMFRPKSYI